MSTVRVETAENPQLILQALMPELEEWTLGVYGEVEGQISGGQPEYFMFPRGRLWVAYVDDEIASMAGWTDLSLLEGHNPFELPAVEIKRLFTRVQFQGQGLGRLLDDYLLHDIFVNGYRLAVGETGKPQAASVHMHSSSPYFRVQPFGEYVGNPDSFFFGASRESWLASLPMRLRSKAVPVLERAS